MADVERSVATDPRVPSSAASLPRPGARTDAAAEAAPGSSGRGAALKFVGRLAQLDLDGVRTAMDAWRDTMRHNSAAWFAAEEALAHAVVRSGRRGEQEPLLIHVAEAFTRLVWYGQRARADHERGAPAPEMRAGGTEATGQYLATLAMLALLVRDHLEDATFALLYRPFAALVPPAQLVPE